MGKRGDKKIMERSDTEIILQAIFEGFGLAANEGKAVTYVFSCDSERGPTEVEITIKPHQE